MFLDVRWNIQNKIRHRVGHHAAKDHAVLRIGHIELLHGSRDSHICKSSGFFHLIGVCKTAGTREEPVLKPHHEDHRKLQTFGAVKGHKGHAVIGFVILVHIRHQHHRFQEFLE